jgi:D-alanyl-D-alanine dipeptidase
MPSTRREFLKFITTAATATAFSEILPACAAIEQARNNSKKESEIARGQCPTTESETPSRFVSLADAGYPSDLIHLVYKDNGGDNKFGCPLYAEDQRAFVVNREMAQSLIAANNYMRENHNLQIKVVDAFRTEEAQKIAYDIAKSRGISTEYVAKPGSGKHPQGRAVDLILVNMNGNKVDMGANFDTFSSEAHYNPSNEYQKMLKNVMIKFGYKPYSSEYWHFSWTE